MYRRRWISLLAAAVLASLVPVVPQFAGAAPTAPSGRGTTSVTLVTGDKVLVLPGGGFAVTPGPGRAGKIGFAHHSFNGRTLVVPSDALRLLAAGKLDERLFDIQELVRQGFEDSKSSTLPLLARYSDGLQKLDDSALSSGGTTVAAVLPSIHGVAMHAARSGALWSALTTNGELSPAIAKLWLDGKRQPTLDHSIPQIGAPAAWQTGNTGKGVTVAVLDTGIDTSHPDFAGRIAEVKSFYEPKPGGPLPQPGDDDHGHGTHVASTIAGSGAASDGKYRGVAPDATIIAGQVCWNGCSESAIIAGMQWAAPRAQVVNMSLGGGDTAGIDPIEEALNTLTAQYGTLFVVAAGNDGPGASTVASPGSADAALTVAAVNGDDAVVKFSSRGPRVGDGGLKPDISGPGFRIVAARAAHGTFGQPGDMYTTLSGTSMATPHVAGAAVLLAAQHHDWKATELKSALMASAKRTASTDVFAEGTGRVDVAKAIAQQITVDQPSLSLGTQEWPHTDDVPVQEVVTFTNQGSTDVTLDLAITGKSSLGADAPAGMFKLTPSTITVPAGGHATAAVTVDTKVSGPDGRYVGALDGTLGGVSAVHIPIAIEKEVESYNFSVAHKDRRGVATWGYTHLYRVDAPAAPLELFNQDDINGTVTVRLPRGTYHLHSQISTTVGEASFSELVQPVLNLTSDKSVVLDARGAKPVKITVPDTNAVPTFIMLASERKVSWCDCSIVDGMYDAITPRALYSQHVGPEAPAGQLTSGAWAFLQHKDYGADGNYGDSPFQYNLAKYSYGGRYFTGLDWKVRPENLASVKTDMRTAALSADVFKLPRGTSKTGFESPYYNVYGIDMPQERVEYYSVEDGLTWDNQFIEFNWDLGDWGEWQYAPKPKYRGGKSYHETWQAAPFGPGFGGPAPAGGFVSRTDDRIQAAIPLFSDAALDHSGYGWVKTSKTTLYRNGEKVGETDQNHCAEPASGTDGLLSCAATGSFTVPDGAATYRLEASADRERGLFVPIHQLSTRVDAAWTFRSQRPSSGTVRPTLLAVRFAPTLDQHNSASAGGSFTIPVSVQEQPNAPQAGPIKTITVQISYDDGTTWQAAPLEKRGTGWRASVVHPAGHGFASLRATAADNNGNKVEQTIIRAYEIK